jgi:hypothetical protein
LRERRQCQGGKRRDKGAAQERGGGHAEYS